MVIDTDVGSGRSIPIRQVDMLQAKYRNSHKCIMHFFLYPLGKCSGVIFTPKAPLYKLFQSPCSLTARFKRLLKVT